MEDYDAEQTLTGLIENTLDLEKRLIEVKSKFSLRGGLIRHQGGLDRTDVELFREFHKLNIGYVAIVDAVPDLIKSSSIRKIYMGAKADIKKLDHIIEGYMVRRKIKR